MAKIFTIMEGVENLGALKTGGQGSVYKAKRLAPVITAIKILPTPIYSEGDDDKNYITFQNEVAKLKKVNEDPSPNVVHILNAGLTESGNLPFIEMEFIDGPDLSELLNPPHTPVFSIREVIKVCEHLANALAHCHRIGIKHGDIKTNNVKFNTLTGNYVLLDFGLSVMTDEQRRTSFRRAGAIEFMAPEQNEGEMLFETDVYSYGVIIFELLAGQVPFPLHGSGETSRNHVLISHLEKEVPDLLELRKQALSTETDEQKRKDEGQVPEWLTQLVYKCLEKNPADRFANGEDLFEFVGNILTQNIPVVIPEDITDVEITPTVELIKERDDLQRALSDYQLQLDKKNKENTELQNRLEQQKKAQTNIAGLPVHPQKNDGLLKAVSKSKFYALSAVTAVLALVLLYMILWKPDANVVPNTSGTASNIITADSSDQLNHRTSNTTTGLPQNNKDKTPATQGNSTSTKASTQQVIPKPIDEQNNGVQDTANASEPKEVVGEKYKAITTANFHNDADESTQRNAFINKWNKPVTALTEKNGFIYVVYTNEEGQTTKGWLRKSDLNKVGE